MNRVKKNRFIQRKYNEIVGMYVAKSDWLEMKDQVQYKEPCLIQILPYCLLLHMQEGRYGRGDTEIHTSNRHPNYYKNTSGTFVELPHTLYCHSAI